MAELGCQSSTRGISPGPGQTLGGRRPIQRRARSARSGGAAAEAERDEVWRNGQFIPRPAATRQRIVPRAWTEAGWRLAGGRESVQEKWDRRVQNLYEWAGGQGFITAAALSSYTPPAGADNRETLRNVNRMRRVLGLTDPGPGVPVTAYNQG